jgi:hypothetical protein
LTGGGGGGGGGGRRRRRRRRRRNKSVFYATFKWLNILCTICDLAVT